MGPNHTRETKDRVRWYFEHSNASPLGQTEGSIIKPNQKQNFKYIVTQRTFSVQVEFGWGYLVLDYIHLKLTTY